MSAVKLSYDKGKLNPYKISTTPVAKRHSDLKKAVNRLKKEFGGNQSKAVNEVLDQRSSGSLRE